MNSFAGNMKVNGQVYVTLPEAQKQREEREKQQRFERGTLKVFRDYNRVTYDKRYREKYGISRKKGAEDYLIKLELLLRGVKNDDYKIEEIVFLRDSFLKKIKKDQLWAAEKVVEEINNLLLAGLEIK